MPTITLNSGKEIEATRITMTQYTVKADIGTNRELTIGQPLVESIE